MLASAERLIRNGLRLVEPVEMDEPTIDCSYCGRHGVVEQQLHALDGAADWSKIHFSVLCSTCLEAAIPASVGLLKGYERIVLMPL